MTRRRLLVALVVLALVAGTAGTAVAYVASKAKAQERFSIAEAGDPSLAIEPIEGKLAPGGSLDVSFRVSNGTAWAQRVGRVVLDDPGVTGLPDGCTERAFSWASKPLNVTLEPGESVKATGDLGLDKGAPAACAGADPTLRLVLA